MISLKKKQSGFTIVELLIVIVVIGILAALVINTFSGIQKKARDTKRTTDIGTIHGQLEAYFTNNGTYPTLANLQSSTWVAANLKGFDANALKDPNLGSTTPFPAGTVANNNYGYAPLKSDDTACDNTTGNECVKYTLTANKEQGGTVVKNSLN